MFNQENTVNEKLKSRADVFQVYSNGIRENSNIHSLFWLFCGSLGLLCSCKPLLSYSNLFQHQMVSARQLCLLTAFLTGEISRFSWPFFSLVAFLA